VTICKYQTGGFQRVEFLKEWRQLPIAVSFEHTSGKACSSGGSEGSRMKFPTKGSLTLQKYQKGGLCAV
jgi:hypothetical protein